VELVDREVEHVSGAGEGVDMLDLNDRAGGAVEFVADLQVVGVGPRLGGLVVRV
jgi:hypothetical protein